MSSTLELGAARSLADGLASAGGVGRRSTSLRAGGGGGIDDDDDDDDDEGKARGAACTTRAASFARATTARMPLLAAGGGRRGIWNRTMGLSNEVDDVRSQSDGSSSCCQPKKARPTRSATAIARIAATSSCRFDAI